MATALVIGGTAFIGRALVERLLERGDEVTILHRGASTPFGDRVAEIRCDRNDISAIRRAMKGRSFDAVFDNVYDWERGTTGDQVAAAASAAGESSSRYVFTSSIAVYGEGLDLPEDAALLPPDHPNVYGAQKADSERQLFELHRRGVVTVATLRPAFIYGPHNPFDREAFFWDRITAGRPVIVPDDGSTPMQWVHVGDVVSAALIAATADAAAGRAYNVAGPPVTQLEFVRILAEAAGRDVTVTHVPRDVLRTAGGQLTHPPLYFGAYLDLPPLTVRTERLRTELGLEPRSLVTGLRETFEWYSQQRRPRPDFSWEDRVMASTRTARA